MDRCNRLFETDWSPHSRIAGVLDAVEDITGFVRGAVVLLKEGCGRPTLYAHARGKKPDREFAADMGKVQRIIASDDMVGVVRSVLAESGNIVLEDVFDNGTYIAADAAIRSEACVPLVIRGQTIGALNFESARPRAFDHEDLTLFKTLATQIALTVELSGARQSLGRMAVVGPH